MVYPVSSRDQLKYWFWRFYTPLHPIVRDVSAHFGVSKVLMWYAVPEGKQTGRQDFLLGTLDPSRSVRDFVSFLVSQGFGNHFVAWKDSDELVSLRRVVDFRHQYHIRVFTDGEVRCHYEFTPEHHPYLHWAERGEEERGKDFLSFCGNWVIPV